MESNVQNNKYGFISYLVFSISLVIVLLHLVPIVFPTLYTAFSSKFQSSVSPYEIGTLTVPFLVINLFLLALSISYYKKFLPRSIMNTISFILLFSRKFEVSKKVAMIVFGILIVGYMAFTIEELGEYEKDTFPDFYYIEKILLTDPITEGEGVFTRYAHFYLDYWSQEYFGNIRIIPFISSIFLLVLTYFFTVQLTNKRFAGLVSMAILLQSFTFYRYDTSATYPSYWVLFYLLSLYLIQKKWQFSTIPYFVSIFVKQITTVFIPLTLFFVFRSNISRRKKIYITISYVPIIIIIALFVFSDTGITGRVSEFNSIDFWNALTTFSFQMRFDELVLIFLLPLTVALFLISRRGIKAADSILILMVGVLFSSALMATFTAFYVQPYRFLVFVVFFAIGVGVLFSKRPIKIKNLETK